MQHGVVVIDKPTGVTSARVVAQVKRALGARRVGHTGTLDPLATGVLPLCVGEGTKLAGHLLAEDKHYDADLVFGVETDTLDREGQVVRRRESEAAAVTRAAVLGAMAELTGDIEQVPPMFSALKQGGVRLHELARKGVTVDRPPRPVHIHRFELLSLALPAARVRVHCSKGTYIRTLVADLGEALGCGAHVTELRRTRSGAFGLDRAVALETVLTGKLAPEHWISPPDAVGHLPRVHVAPELVGPITQGQRVSWRKLSDDPAPPTACLIAPDGALLALAGADQGRVRYQRVFTYALTSQASSSNLPASHNEQN